MTNPTRVLLVGNFLSRHRATRMVAEDLAVRLEGAGWPVITTSSVRVRPARLAHMVATVVTRRNDYDVAHVDVFSSAAFRWAEASTWALRRVGKPYVLTLHGGNLPQLARRSPQRVRRLLDGAAAVTAPSPFLRRELSTRIGWDEERILHLPNPLDLASYHYQPRTTPRPRLVWLRAFHPTYDPVTAVRTAARLAEDVPDVRLNLVGPDTGDGSLGATVEEIRRLGLEDQVAIVGPVPKDQVPLALASGDIFLNTSRIDNTPVTVLEALASGLPVVSTNIGGLPHLLDDGHDALLVPPDDPDAMAAAVRRLLDEPGLAGRLAAAGHEKVEACDWSRVLPRWQALLGAVARGAAPPEAP
jgi:glycosyltransferase involved in cell wall biosynthesis